LIVSRFNFSYLRNGPQRVQISVTNHHKQDAFIKNQKFCGELCEFKCGSHVEKYLSTSYPHTYPHTYPHLKKCFNSLFQHFSDLSTYPQQTSPFSLFKTKTKDSAIGDNSSKLTQYSRSVKASFELFSLSFTTIPKQGWITLGTTSNAVSFLNLSPIIIPLSPKHSTHLSTEFPFLDQ
jgi:hypothetical protein